MGGLARLSFKKESKKISNDQELIQSDPTSCRIYLKFIHNLMSVLLLLNFGLLTSDRIYYAFYWSDKQWILLSCQFLHSGVLLKFDNTR